MIKAMDLERSMFKFNTLNAERHDWSKETSWRDVLEEVFYIINPPLEIIQTLIENSLESGRGEDEEYYKDILWKSAGLIAMLLASVQVNLNNLHGVVIFNEKIERHEAKP
jgi:hypothetical protein